MIISNRSETTQLIYLKPQIIQLIQNASQMTDIFCHSIPDPLLRCLQILSDLTFQSGNPFAAHGPEIESLILLCSGRCEDMLNQKNNSKTHLAIKLKIITK